MNQPKSKRGITLAEVLVCLAILFVLALMILSMFSRGGQALTIRCINNQKQLALGVLIYAGDNKDRFPNLDEQSGNDGPIALLFLTNLVAGQTNLFMCPFVVNKREKDRSWYQKRFTPSLTKEFFRSNGNDYAYYDGALCASNTNAFIADRMAWTNRSSSDTNLLNHPNRRLNAAFIDGHVENIRVNETVGSEYNPTWSAVQDPIRRP